jgi:nondiscriminating glutamyl-tRNA synthetase
MFTLAELEKEFSIDRVGKAGAVFDIDKLRWFNEQYLRALPPERLADICAPWMKEAGFDTSDAERTRSVTSALKQYLSLPSDITEHLRLFAVDTVSITDPATMEMIAGEEAQLVFARFVALAPDVHAWVGEEIKAMIKTIQKDTGVKGKQLFMPLRLALTGDEHGPDLGMIAELLGREQCIDRIKAQLR